MPLPIVPAPTTPIFLISIRFLSVSAAALSRRPGNP